MRPPRYTESQARHDLIRAMAALGRHCSLSGNRKLADHWVVLRSFVDVALPIMDATDPEVIKSQAITAEIKSRLDGQPCDRLL